VTPEPVPSPLGGIESAASVAPWMETLTPRAEEREMNWTMGTDATKCDAYIENEDGNAVISLTRLAKPGLASIRLPTDAEWESILDCIAAAPALLDAAKSMVLAFDHGDADSEMVALRQIREAIAKAEPQRVVRRRVRVAVEVAVDVEADATDEVAQRLAVELVRDGEGQVVSHDLVS
jgi:hypothetical protein